MKEIKRLVTANQDTLLALHTNRDKPEIFHEVLRKMRSMCVCVCACVCVCECVSVVAQLVECSV